MSNRSINAKLKSLARELDAAATKAVAEKISAEKSFMASQPPEVIVEKVKKGEMVPPSFGSDSEEEDEVWQRLFDAGLLTAIGSFLNEGIHDEFKSSLKGFFITANTKTGKQMGVESITPKIFLCSLTQCVAIATGSSLDDKRCATLIVEVVHSISSFIECMCDDISREIFKSKKCYHELLRVFFNLIVQLLVRDSSETAEALLECDGLIDFIIQSLFWRTHRPDIIQELKSYSTFSDLDEIEKLARYSIEAFILCATKQVFVDGRDKNYDDQAKDIYEIVATTPIVSNAFDPNNDKIFLSNIATLMKVNSFYKLKELDQEFFYDVLLRSSNAGLIDKHVISSVIDLLASVRSCDVARRVVDVTFNMLCKRTGQWIGEKKELPIVTEDDERFAVAINNGMCESLLNMHSRLADEKQDSELRKHVLNLLDSVYRVLARRWKRSTKAIENKRGSIEDALQKYKLSRKKDLRVSRIVITILSMNSLETCYQCFKFMEKKEVRRCARCKMAKYCSRECQVKHWKSGQHKEFCNEAAKNAEEIKSNGGSDHDVLLQNSAMDTRMRGIKVYLKHSVSIVYQAVSKGYDILDCVVDVDVRVSPPSVEVILSEDFLDLDMNKETDTGYETKKTMIEEARKSKSLAFNYHGKLAGQVIPHAAPASSVVPGSASLLGQTWPKLQDTVKVMRNKMDGMVEMIEKVPEFVDELEMIFVQNFFDLKDLGDGRAEVVKKKSVPIGMTVGEMMESNALREFAKKFEAESKL